MAAYPTRSIETAASIASSRQNPSDVVFSPAGHRTTLASVPSVRASMTSASFARTVRAASVGMGGAAPTRASPCVRRTALRSAVMVSARSRRSAAARRTVVRVSRRPAAGMALAGWVNPARAAPTTAERAPPGVEMAPAVRGSPAVPAPPTAARAAVDATPTSGSRRFHFSTAARPWELRARTPTVRTARTEPRSTCPAPASVSAPSRVTRPS